MFWFQLLIWTAISIATELIRPKPSFEDARPKSLGDFKFPTATEGRVVPLIWGKVKLEGPNMIWYGNFRKRPRTENVKTGMFSSEDVIIGYYYFVGLQYALCHGVVDALGTVWINDKVVSSTGGAINAPNLYGGVEHGSGGVTGAYSFYNGSKTQSLNTYLGAFQSPQPAYIGTSHFVFEGGWVGMSNNVPTWAFELTRIPDGLNMAAADPGAEAPNTYDANPMNVLYEILTDTDWGLSISSSDIDIPNFQAAASTLAAEGNGFSMIVDNAIEISKLVEEVQRQIDGSLFFNRVEGQWQVVLVRDDYDPGPLTVYDESSIKDLKEYHRRSWEETSNQVRVAFVDRDDEYKETFALAQDPANADIQGQSVMSDITYPGVKEAALANSIAWRDLRALSFPLAKISFTVNRKAFALTPGGLFKFSWDQLGISGAVFRVTKINYGKFGESDITVDAFQDIFSTDVGTFGDPTSSGWTDPEDDAAAPTANDSLIFEAPRQITLQDTFSSDLNPRVWMGARWPGDGTLVLQSYNRAGASQPVGGAYSADTTIPAFVIVGTLDADIPAYGTTAARPATSYNIDVDELDPLDPILVDGGPALISELTTIVWIDGEWLGFEQATDQGGGVFRLRFIHRGLFNSAPKAHASGTRVWFMSGAAPADPASDSVGGGLTRRVLASTEVEMDIQLRGVNAGNEETTEGATPELEVSIADLYLCPLAPRDPVVNSVYAPSSEDIDTSYTSETGRSGDDALAMEVEVTPRDWTQDNPLLDTVLRATDWLGEDPEFDFHLSLDPDGTPADTAVVTIGSTETPTAYILRNDVIIAVGANRSIPSTGRIVTLARHTLNAVDYTNPYDMEFDLTITSALQSADDITHGGVDDTASTAVVYGESGNYTIDIHTALPPTGVLQAQVNAGGWVTIIGIGLSSGILAITANDSVELRTQTAKPADDQFFDVTGPTAEMGYGVLLS